MDFFGVNMSRPLGFMFAPIGHNWLYGFTGEDINKILHQIGLVDAGDKFQTMMGNKKKAVLNHTREEFLNEIMPAVDIFLQELSYGGTYEFIFFYFVLGYYLGFDLTFLYYTLLQIGLTETVSAIDKYNGGSVAGNSIFHYCNGAMFLLLFLVKGWKSRWFLIALGLWHSWEHVSQFWELPWVSIAAHSLGSSAGVLSWLYLYKKRLPIG